MGSHTRIILAIIGAVFGILCGLISGKYNIYYILNKSNTISYNSNPEHEPPKQDTAGKIFGSMIGFLFMIAGIIMLVVNITPAKDDFETYGTLLAFAIFLTLFGGFIGFGVLFSKNN